MSTSQAVDQEPAYGILLSDRLGRAAAREKNEFGRLEERADAECQTAALTPGLRMATLDTEVSKLRVTNGIFPADRPAAEAVDGAALLDEIAGVFRRYVALPAHADTLLALWVVHTYVYDAGEHTPILALSSPTPRCGKTTTLSVLRALTHRALPASNITAAIVFRAVEAWHPTLLIDEADSFLPQNEALRGILNCGHQKDLAWVLRLEAGRDGNYKPRRFSAWCPKAIALIGELPATLADRSIQVKLRRRLMTEQVDRFRPSKFDGTPIRGRILRWMKDHQIELTSETETPASLNDRAADNWQPLITLAAAAGGDWPGKARGAAMALSGETEDEAAGVMLLVDVVYIFEDLASDYLPSSEIIQHLVAMEMRPWLDWHHGKPITARHLARLLAGFGIAPGTKRFGEKTARGYSREQFTEPAARYTHFRPDTPTHPLIGAASSPFLIRNTNSDVPDHKTRQPAGGAGCVGVSDETPPDSLVVDL